MDAPTLDPRIDELGTRAAKVARQWREVEALRSAFYEANRAEPKDKDGDEWLIWKTRSERALRKLVDMKLPYEAAANEFFATVAKEYGL